AELVLPTLVRDLLVNAPVSPLPGLCFRDRGEVFAVDEAAGAQIAMDCVPLPSYDEYFARLDRASFAADIQDTVTLFYEGARGCWWGEKSQCTFCGISSLAMPFRSKSADRVVDEIFELAKRYQRLDFLIVDYIMDLRYLSEVLPRLRDAGCDLRLF